jgi:hypothetical protein
VVNQKSAFSIDSTSVNFYFWQNAFITNYVVQVQHWYHMCLVYDGSTRFIYIDNVMENQQGSSIAEYNANMIGSIGNESIPLRDHLNGAISQFRVYNGALSADQINDIYRSQLPYHILDHAVIALTTKDFVNADTRASSSTSWGGFSMISSRAPALNNDGDVVFDLSRKHFLSASSVSLNCASNGGFTAIVYARFEATNNFERVFEFGNGAPNNTVVLTRYSTTNAIEFAVSNGTTLQSITADIIVNGAWHVYACKHDGASLSLWLDGSQVAATPADFTITNRTTSGNYIGRSNWSDTEYYFQGSMRGLLVFDRALSDTEMVVMSQWLRDTT